MTPEKPHYVLCLLVHSVWCHGQSATTLREETTVQLKSPVMDSSNTQFHGCIRATDIVASMGSDQSIIVRGMASLLTTVRKLICCTFINRDRCWRIQGGHDTHMPFGSSHFLYWWPFPYFQLPTVHPFLFMLHPGIYGRLLSLCCIH